MADTEASEVARRAFLSRGVAAGAVGAAAGVLANIEQLIAAEGSRSGAGFVTYMTHDRARAQSLVDFMKGQGFTERAEFSVAARGAHRDIWGRGTRPFDAVQSIMAGPGGFAVLVGQGASSPTASAPNAQVWVASGAGDADASASAEPGAEFAPAAVYVANDAGVQEAS